jgi:hypothetical protein
MLFAAFGLASQSVPAQGRSRAGQPSPPPPATTQTPPPTTTQQQQQSQDAEPGSDVSQESADLAITAHVTARELRFETVPNPQVQFTGQPRRETQWDAVRENLPRPVQPGVTYRNIGVRLKIVSVFADIDRIVAEALGEVPIKDELPPEKNQNESSSPTQDQSQPKPAPVQGTSSDQTGARPQ